MKIGITGDMPPENFNSKKQKLFRRFNTTNQNTRVLTIPKVTPLLKLIIIFAFLSIIIAFSLTAKNQEKQIYKTGVISINETFQNNMLKTAGNGMFDIKYENENIYESQEIKPEFKFNGLILSWVQFTPQLTDAKIYVKFKNNGKWQQSWHLAEIDDDNPVSDFQHEFIADALILTDSAESFKYKVITATADNNLSPKIKGLSFEYIQASDVIVSPVKSEELYASLIIPGGGKSIISRTAWGANESLIYQDIDTSNGKDLSDLEKSAEITSDTKDSTEKKIPQSVKISKVIETDPINNKDYKWPLQYPESTKKIIIHHTATTKDIKRPMVAIRNIYYYHTVRKGWGDIGYNYIIDSYGNIYEGRKGGDSVIGGHAYGFNTGTIGIALLGNYENEEPSYEMINSLVHLLNDLTEKHNIAAQGVSEFNGKVVPNIAGHFQVQATKCPGAKVKEILPDIRKLTAQTSNSDSLDSSFSATGQASDNPEKFNFEEYDDYSPIRLSPDQTATFEIKLKNTGSETWTNETFIIADQNGLNQGRIEFPEKYSISKQQENLVKPGEVGTFKMKIKSGLRSGFIVFDVTPIYNGNIKTDKYLSLPVYIDKLHTGYTVTDKKINKEKFSAGEVIEGYFEIENLSGIDWTNSGQNEVKLIFDSPLWRQSSIMPKGELVLATLQQQIVHPGEIGRFDFRATAPGNSGIFEEKIAVYNDSVGRFEGDSLTLNFTVGTPKPAANFVTISNDTNFKPGETKLVSFQLKNIGSTTWRRIGEDALKVVSINNPAIKVPEEITFNESVVNPGEIANFKFYVTAPAEEGNHSILFVPWYKYMRLLNEPVIFRFNVGDSDASLQTNISNNEPPIRVKISSKNATNYYSLANPSITSSTNFSVISGGEILNTFNYGEILNINYKDNKYYVTGDKIAFVSENPIRIVPENDGKIEIINMERRPTWNTKLNDNIFRGIIEVRNFNGELILINELPLEDYIKGMGEVENSAPYEKIKTITVLARTYAKYYRDLDQKFPGAPYHLNDNPDECQKYLGYNFELRAPMVAKAAVDTKGKTVTYEGKLIKTPYFNSSDGRTRSAQEVWGWTNTPYLQSVADPLCKEGVLRGHGVGLSGCGATAAAQTGKSYEEIIKYYFKGVEIE